MLSSHEYRALDGVEMARLVRSKQLTAAELLECAIAVAEAENPRLNALVIPMFELARERAASSLLAGPFAGVPFLLKDLHQDYAGVLATSGCRAYRANHWTPRRHSEIVERWLQAGCVVFGRTNACEFGAKAITEPDAWVPVCRLMGPGSWRFFQPQGTTRFSGTRDHLSG